MVKQKTQQKKAKLPKDRHEKRMERLHLMILSFPWWMGFQNFAEDVLRLSVTASHYLAYGATGTVLIALITWAFWED